MAQYREDDPDFFDWFWRKCRDAGATEAEKEALLEIHAALAVMGGRRTGADEREGLNAFIFDLAMRLPADSKLNALMVLRQMERVRLGVRGSVSDGPDSDPEATVPRGYADQH